MHLNLWKYYFNICLKKKSVDDVNKLFINLPTHKIRTALKLEKLTNGKIPASDLLKFHDFLFKRLLTLGLFFGANLTCTGINFLLQKNSYCSKVDINKHFTTYLFLPLKDQLSTDMDLLIANLDKINATMSDFRYGDDARIKLLNDKSKSPYNPEVLKLLSPVERKYDILFNDLADYEKQFVKDICNYSLANSEVESLNEHLQYILTNVTA